MITFLYDLPDAYLLLFLCVFTILSSILCIHLVRRYVPLDLRYRDNPMLGNMSACISIIYGVLVGLTALYLINNINTTADAVQREANAAADFYRDTQWLQEPVRSRIVNDLRRYLENTIDVEWKLMKAGIPVSHAGDRIIDDMTAAIKQIKVRGQADIIIVRDMLENIKTLYDSRQLRLQMSFNILNPAIWAVVIIGTILMVVVCCFYSMNYYLHLITISAVSIMSAAMIYLLISLDRPFQGEYLIESHVLKSVLYQINHGINH